MEFISSFTNKNVDLVSISQAIKIDYGWFDETNELLGIGWATK